MRLPPTAYMAEIESVGYVVKTIQHREDVSLYNSIHADAQLFILLPPVFGQTKDLNPWTNHGFEA